MQMTAIYFGVLGLIVGSFLNVLILRKGVMSLSGRSKCPSCGKLIYWYDNIPVISWLILRGRCRNCGSSISLQYPLVEALTGILFLLVGTAAYPAFLLSSTAALLLLLELTMVSILIAITVYDLRHTIIPDEWVYSFAVLALVISFATNLSTVHWVPLLLAGPLAALPLFLLWLVSAGTWMGFGDPKLALGIGWLLGMPLGIVAVFFSFIIGSVVLVPILLYERLVTHTASATGGASGLTMKSEVPFGPFLIAACLIFWLLELHGVSIPLYLLGF